MAVGAEAFGVATAAKLGSIARNELVPVDEIRIVSRVVEPLGRLQFALCEARPHATAGILEMTAGALPGSFATRRLRHAMA
jgi:hypothetical protein